MPALKIALHDILVELPPEHKTLFRVQTFTVPAGGKILIQGESGRGKTTLLHLMAGLFHPAKGTVTVGDQRLTDLSDEARCRFRRQNIGTIFQKLNLLEHLTAIENVMLACGDAEKAAHALRSVGLSARTHTRSSVLSLGEQQRVAVARVLACQSPVILADEPTSSLDAKNAAHVMDLLFEAARDKTFVVVSHDERIERRFDSRFDFSQVAQA